MSKIKLLIKDITRVRAIQLKKGVTLREKDILYSFSPNSVMLRPWMRLPDVKEMSIRTNMADVLLEKFGLSKNFEPEIEFIALNRKIRASNRYLSIMEYRLEKLLRKHDSHGFWILALMLMEKSKVLRLVALRKLDINWFKRWSLNKISKMLHILDVMIENMEMTNFIVRRYVPKGDSWRPIGSPSFPDRMFLYIWQCFFVMFLSKYISAHQHAYLPGRGVNSALADLARHLSDKKWKYVWEFDLKGAFPSVHVPNTCKELARRGLPHHIATLIEAMGLSTIERVDLSLEGRQLEEPKFDLQVVMQNLGFNPEIFSAPTLDVSLLAGFLTKMRPKKNESIGQRMARLFSDPTLAKGGPTVTSDTDGLEGVASAPIELIRRMLKFDEMTGLARGFPQGSGLSPVLFNFAFETMIKRVHFDNKKYLTHGEISVVSYADDFLVFSEKYIPWHILVNMPFKPVALQDIQVGEAPWWLKHEAREFEGMVNEIAMLNQLETRDLGLKFNEKKSSIIREVGSTGDSIPIKTSFKFLGTTFTQFITSDEIAIRGTPRDGKVMNFDVNKSHMVESHKLRAESLAFLRKSLSHPSFDRPANEVLNSWGRGEYPARLLPMTLIRDGQPLNPAEIQEIERKVHLNSILGLSSDDPNFLEPHFGVVHGPGFITYPVRDESVIPIGLLDLADDEALSALPSHTVGGSGAGDKSKHKTTSHAQLQSKFNKLLNKIELGISDAGDKIKYLTSPLAGVIQSRLFGGSWVNAESVDQLLAREDEVNTRKLQEESNKGSWLNQRKNAKFEAKIPIPDWYSSWTDSEYSNSSYATLDLINSLGSTGVVKQYQTTGRDGIKFLTYRAKIGHKTKANHYF